MKKAPDVSEASLLKPMLGVTHHETKQGQDTQNKALCKRCEAAAAQFFLAIS
jgi:hypothetical protein